MEARVETLPELRVVGLEARCVSILSPRWKPNSTIPDLWHRFMDRRSEVESAQGGRDLGVCRRLPAGEGAAPDEFQYLACTESLMEKVPDGMLAVVVPAGRYARFVHRGPISGLRATMREIYEVWFPASGHIRRDAPDLEIYGPRFKGDAGDSELDVCVPIR